MTVYEYAKRTVYEGVFDSRQLEITDFFELITYLSMKKFKILLENPYIWDFSIRSFYSDKEDISGDLKERNKKAGEQTYEQYFSNIDLSKFKEGVDPGNIFQMIIWMTDGYMHEQQMHKKPLCLDAIDKTLANWTAMFKQIAYKEEYL